MFRDKYKEHFNNVKPKEELINKVKEKMILEVERKNKNIFFNKKLAYGLSLALIMLIIGKLYIPKNLGKDKNLEFSMESQLTENGLLDIQGEYRENQVIEDNRRKENSEIEFDERGESTQYTERLDSFTLSEEERNIEFSKVEINNGMPSLALNFEKETEDVTLTYEEYKNYLGINFLPKYLPEGFELEKSLDEIKISNIFYKGGGVAYDPALIRYSDKRDIENSKFIDLIVSKIDYLPTSDFSFSYRGELKEEIINNQKVYLGYDTLLSTKFHSQEEIEELNKNDEYSLYIARFEKDGVYYSLTSSFLGKEEFLKVLKSLI